MIDGDGDNITQAAAAKMVVKNNFGSMFMRLPAIDNRKRRALEPTFPVSSFWISSRERNVHAGCRDRKKAKPEFGKSRFAMMLPVGVGDTTRHGLFENVERQMVTIKAVRSRGGIIQWNYDTPQQASRLWKKIVETGRAPDTDESLYNAAYFGPKNNPGEGPDKYWVA